ncbi:MAG TPA: hypothetical protein VN449_03715 [Gaiellaceae bacterium]|nr:hypothetical protein [Gaiellaceae bacterium]
MQLRRKRSSQRRHRAKQAAIAVGAVGLAAEGTRRLRKRRHNDEAAES